MANVREVIYTRLTGHAGLMALIGTRVYPRRLPQEPTYPAVTYQMVGGDDNEVFFSDLTGIAKPHIQIDAWGLTLKSAYDVMYQVERALHLWDAPTSNPVVLNVMKLQGARDLDEPEENIGHVSQDFEIWHVD